MNIIHIIPNLSKGGAERLVLDICQELTKREGVQVLLVTFSNENQYPEIMLDVPCKVAEVSINLSLWKSNKINVSSLQENWTWSERQWSKASNDTGIGNPIKSNKEKGEQSRSRARPLCPIFVRYIKPSQRKSRKPRN